MSPGRQTMVAPSMISILPDRTSPWPVDYTVPTAILQDADPHVRLEAPQQPGDRQGEVLEHRHAWIEPLTRFFARENTPGQTVAYVLIALMFIGMLLVSIGIVTGALVQRSPSRRPRWYDYRG